MSYLKIQRIAVFFKIFSPGLDEETIPHTTLTDAIPWYRGIASNIITLLFDKKILALLAFFLLLDKNK